MFVLTGVEEFSVWFKNAYFARLRRDLWNRSLVTT